MFANTSERWHFAEYLTGLMVAGRKNVSAINAEFAQTADPSFYAQFSAGNDRHLQHPGRP